MDELNEKKEVMLFTAPRTVKRKKISDIFIYQLIVVGAFLAFLFLLKLGATPIFENIIDFIRGYIL